jgi:hypothetical protein
MAEETEAYGSSGVSQIEDKQLWTGSTVNGAYERIENPKAVPPVQPEIRLIEGWRNGNIKISVAGPADSPDTHTWDVWLQVSSITSDSWEAVTAIFVRVP